MHIYYNNPIQYEVCAIKKVAPKVNMLYHLIQVPKLLCRIFLVPPYVWDDTYSRAKFVLCKFTHGLAFAQFLQ